MSIDEIYNRFSKITPQEKLSSFSKNSLKINDNGNKEDGESFASFLKDAVKGVNSLQREADQKIEDLV